METLKSQRSKKFSQESKRQEFLSRQKESRRQVSSLHRQDILFSLTSEQRHQLDQHPQHEHHEHQQDHHELQQQNERILKKQKRKKVKNIYQNKRTPPSLVCNELCGPEWMIEIPDDLYIVNDNMKMWRGNDEGGENHPGAIDTCNGLPSGRSNWFILPRPEGKRCLVVSSKGKTISYLESGQILHNFRSVLPGGGLHSRQGSSAILDCIYSPINRTYYILDLMNWNEMSCYECDAEFRFYWLHTKYSETSGLCSSSPALQPYSFHLIPYWECDSNGLYQAYAGQFDFIKNGLLFYHREGHYEANLTPLVLLWKDPYVSRYVDKDDPRGIPIALQAVIKDTSTNDFLFSTLDQIPLLELSDLRASSSVEDSNDSLLQISSGDLLRGYISQVGYSLDHGQPMIAGFILDMVCKDHKVAPDSWSKIVFKYLLKFSPITIKDIYEALQHSPPCLNWSLPLPSCRNADDLIRQNDDGMELIPS